MTTPEIPPSASHPIDTDNYRIWGSWGVRARFLVNEALFNGDDASRRLDVDAAILHAIHVHENPDMSVLDAGTSDAAFLLRAKTEFGAKRLTGIDIHPSQFSDSASHERDMVLDKVLGELLSRTVSNTALDSLPSLHAEERDLRLQEGSVTDLSQFSENEFDVVTALFMLYHVPPDDQAKALSEIKRVLTPDGLAVFATSGKENKATHRLFERILARWLKAEPPHKMNSDFTTSDAELILPDNFDNVFELKQEEKVLINNPLAREAWLNSQLSLYPQYRRSTPITRAEFEDALARLDGVLQHNSISEKIHRSIFICTNDNSFVPGDISLVTDHYRFNQLRKNGKLNTAT